MGSAMAGVSPDVKNTTHQALHWDIRLKAIFPENGYRRLENLATSRSIFAVAPHPEAVGR